MYKAQPKGGYSPQPAARSVVVSRANGPQKTVIDLGTILVNFLMFAQVQRFKESLHVTRNLKIVQVKTERGAFVRAQTDTKQEKDTCSSFDEDGNKMHLSNRLRPDVECIQPTTFRNSDKIKITQSDTNNGFYKSTLFLRLGVLPKEYQSTMFIIPRDFQFMSEIEFFIGDGKRPERFAIMPEQEEIR